MQDKPILAPAVLSSKLITNPFFAPGAKNGFVINLLESTAGTTLQPHGRSQPH
ncbi:MAG TPA: hypothetical protein VFB12_15690 [Ktedonobacteraceae bacterium]|nr:hypothetical protein [Ktedonobacteraceae bacterium]